MTININRGTEGAPGSGENPVTHTIETLNYASNYRIKVDDPDKVVYVSLIPPTDRPSVLTFAQRAKANIYAGSSTSPEYHAGTKSGTDTLVELRQVFEVTDSEDPDAPIRHLPVRIALQMSLPDADYDGLDGSVSDAIIELLDAVSYVDGSGDSSLTTGVRMLRRGLLRK